MLISVYKGTHTCVYAYVYIPAWAQCCLFGIEGNTRALSSGTAILQSRFFVGVFREIGILKYRVIEETTINNNINPKFKQQ